MSKVKQCYKCSTMLATEKNKQAWLARTGEKGRNVEVCDRCWWYLVAHGMEATGTGRHRETLNVPVKQRLLFEDEKRPTARKVVGHGAA